MLPAVAFGVLRAENILGVGNGGQLRVQLVGFDWAGRAHVEVYHEVLNTEIRYHDGAVIGKTLAMEHDLHWIGRFEEGVWRSDIELPPRGQ